MLPRALSAPIDTTAERSSRGGLNLFYRSCSSAQTGDTRRTLAGDVKTRRGVRCVRNTEAAQLDIANRCVVALILR